MVINTDKRIGRYRTQCNHLEEYSENNDLPQVLQPLNVHTDLLTRSSAPAALHSLINPREQGTGPMVCPCILQALSESMRAHLRLNFDHEEARDEQVPTLLATQTMPMPCCDRRQDWMRVCHHLLSDAPPAECC